MDQPKVSVIIPVYNTEKYLRECLDSVVNQTLRDIEIICVDDGSTDGSLAILREYEAKDSRIRVLTQPNSYAAVARNRGFLHAKGKYTIFLDADDLFEENLLEASLSAAERDCSDICAFHFTRFDEQGNEEKRIGVHTEQLPPGIQVFNYGDCPDLIMTIVNPTPWNKLYRTDFIRENSFRFDEISSTDDISFASVSVAAANRISALPEYLVHYRVGHAGTISSRAGKRLNNVLTAVKSGVSQVRQLPHYEQIKNSAMRFAIENIVFAFRNYISDFNDPAARDFYADVKAFFNTPLFHDCSLNALHSKTLYDYFHCIRNNGYYELVLMISGNTFPENFVVDDLIVSLTSYPPRIGTVHKTIETLLNQTVKPGKLILWLSEEEFPAREKELPKELLEQTARGLEIGWCRNLKSHKKYYYSMREYPDSIIITVDDDLYYPNNLIETLIRSYMKFPYAVSAVRAHRITFDQEGKIAPYIKWDQVNRTAGVPSYSLFATSGAGTLFPPHCMHKELFNTGAIESLCLNADDLWLKAMQMLNGTPVVIAGHPVPLQYIEGTQEVALWKSNVTENRNDEQLARILEKYDSFPGEKDTITQRIWVSSLSFHEAEALRRDLEKQKKEAEALRRDLEKQKQRADKLQRDLEKQKKRADTLQYDLDCVHNSASFRVGRGITYLPRKLRDAVSGDEKTDSDT